MFVRGPYALSALSLALAGCPSPPDRVPTTIPSATSPAASVSASVSAAAEAPLVGARQLVTQGPSCALLADGGVSCWAGELGATPRRARGVTDAARVVTGRGEVAVLRKSGEIVIGAEGASAFTGVKDAIAYAREYEDRCVVRKDGSLWCAGMGAATLTKIQGISDARDVSVGRTHSCALVGERGLVFCFQQSADKPFASPVKGLEGATEVAAGALVGCARKADSSIHCFSMQTPGWGAAPAGSASAMAVGDIYDGTPSTFLCTASGKFARCRFVESSAGDLTRGSELFSITAAGDIRQLSANFGGVCALDDGGQVVCTGSNNSGELGLASPGFIDTPTKLEGFSALRAVTLGDNFACGLTRDGGVECTTRLSPPTPVPGFDSPVTSLTGLGEVVCGTAASGAVSCFKPDRDQKPAKRFPELDNSRALHSRDPHHAIAIVSKDGRLSLGAFAFDMAKLTIRPVADTRDLSDAKLGGSMATADSSLSEVWLLDTAGKVERAIAADLKLTARKKVPALDGAAVLGEDGRVIKQNGELWSAERLLRKPSPFTSLIGDTPCGATKDGQLLCLDALGHLSAGFGAAGDPTPAGPAAGASNHWGMTCVVAADGAPRCSGRDNIGMLDGQRRTQRSTETHRVPLRAAP